jgi:hypothetical protein
MNAAMFDTNAAMFNTNAAHADSNLITRSGERRV